MDWKRRVRLMIDLHQIKHVRNGVGDEKDKEAYDRVRKAIIDG